MKVCGRGHLLDDRVPGNCTRCRRLRNGRTEAIRHGRPLCESGEHALAGWNLGDDGSCIECSDIERLLRIPPSPTWLDWAAVHQAIQGLELVRPLTRYEVVCAIHTLATRNDWSRSEACDYLRRHTRIPEADIPADHGAQTFLMSRWTAKHGLPLLTVQQAMLAEVMGAEDVTAPAA